MKYWKDGFHQKSIEGSVPITDEYWEELLQGQMTGKRIISNSEGYPILADQREPTPEEQRLKEIATLKKYLSDTDYIYPKCLELGLDVDIEYADVVSQRKSARTRIQELEE